MSCCRMVGQKRISKGKEPKTPAIVPPSPDSSDTDMDCLTPMIDIGNPDEEFEDASVSGPDPDAPLFLPRSSDGQSRPSDREHNKHRSYKATAKDDGQLISSASKPHNKDVGQQNRKSHHEQRGNNDSRCSGHKSHLTDERRSNPTSKSMEDNKSISSRRKDDSNLRHHRPAPISRVDIRPHHLQEQRPVFQPGPSREHTSRQRSKDNSDRRARSHRSRSPKRQRDNVNTEKEERRRRSRSKDRQQPKTVKFRGDTSAKPASGASSVAISTPAAGTPALNPPNDRRPIPSATGSPGRSTLPLERLAQRTTPPLPVSPGPNAPAARPLEPTTLPNTVSQAQAPNPTTLVPDQPVPQAASEHLFPDTPTSQILETSTPSESSVLGTVTTTPRVRSCCVQLTAPPPATLDRLLELQHGLVDWRRSNAVMLDGRTIVISVDAIMAFLPEVDVLTLTWNLRHHHPSSQYEIQWASRIISVTDANAGAVLGTLNALLTAQLVLRER